MNFQLALTVLVRRGVEFIVVDVLYEDLASDAVTVEAFGVGFRCIALDRLIAVKRELGRPRDLLAVQELEALKKLSGG